MAYGWVLRGIVALTVGLGLVTGSAWGQDKPLVLRYAGSLPVTHHVSHGEAMFAKLVGEKTGGRVKVETYPAGQLYKAHDIVAATISGALEIGNNITAVWSKSPIADTMDLPFLIRDAEHMRKAWAREGLLFKAFAADMEKKGMKTLHGILFGSLFDFSNNGRQLKVPGDLKGMKVRSYGALAAESIRTLGGTPVVMDPGEMYLALQRGTIDGVITGITTIDQRKLWEVGKYATITSAGFAVLVGNMNLARYNGLPDDVKRAIAEAGDEVQAWSVDESKRQDQKSLEFIKSKGVQVYQLTAQDRETWGRTLEPVTQGWVKRASAEERAAFEWVRSLK
jgi:TRAP-type C4-dicarboxylate transport system substrate-binding protein